MTLSFQQQPPALLDWMQRKQQQQPAYGGIQQGVLGQGIQQQGHLDTQPSSFSGQQDVLGQMQPRQLFGQQSVLCRQQFGQQLGTTPIGITVVPVQQYVAPVRRLVVVNAPIVYETIVHRVGTPHLGIVVRACALFISWPISSTLPVIRHCSAITIAVIATKSGGSEPSCPP